jgi:type I restriction enzyme S subunit
MGSEWRPSTWGDEISLEYGKSLKGYRESSGTIPVFGSNGAVGWTDKALADGPGVILGRKGAYRGVRYSKDPFFVIDTAYYVKPKTELDMQWLYYAIIHHKLGEIDDGSPIPSTTRSAVYVSDVVIPPLPEQKAITHILGSLDDKIELNRRMNATLEGMAQALFKSWFVDFDPVIDNAILAGNSIPDEFAERAEVRRAMLDKKQNAEKEKSSLHNSSCNTHHSLFPATFQLTEEMGWIPEGWEVIKSSSLFDVRDGTHDSTKQSATGKYLITSRHITGNTIDYSNAYLISEEDFEQVNKRSKVDPYDILLTMIGTVGSPFLVMEEEINFAIKNIGLFKTGVNRTLATYFFTYLKSDFMKAFMESRLAGTTQKYLTLKILREIPIIIPRPANMKGFGAQILLIFDKIHSNNCEVNTLAKLRDTLLPKLISGELRIPDAEKLTEEALV